jgi:hypothetical protein
LRQVVDWLGECPQQWAKDTPAGAYYRDYCDWPRRFTFTRARKWCAIGRLELLANAGKFHAYITEKMTDEIMSANDDSSTAAEVAAAMADLIFFANAEMPSEAADAIEALL